MITWTCAECHAENSVFVLDCGTCGAARPAPRQNAALRQEVRELSVCLDEIRLSLNKLWPLVDSLQEQVKALRGAGGTVTVTSQPEFAPWAPDVQYD